VVSSGEVALNVAVQGTAGDPVLNGRVDLHKASLNLLSLPNGLSNANGTILFTGRQAAIQNVTGIIGGGKVEFAGTVGFGAPLQFRLQATGRKMRIEVPPNFSTSIDADLALRGSSARSLLSGKVTILDAAFRYQTDIGSMLSQVAAPIAAPAARPGTLDNMRLDVAIETAPDVQFRTTLAENIRASANLSLRGTAAHPGMLGRLDVTEGQILFFGSKYTVQQGTVSFYDPNRINPNVNIDLATTVRGVDVDLTVAGPMDRMKLSYRSSPPMPFSELISLLAGGNVTTDPVLAAREPVAPQQSFQQMGASALLGEAVANPVSGRLQRLFGVSRLSISPQLVGVQNTPRARITVEQNVSSDITLTVVEDVTQANPEVVRAEWAIDPKWSAVLERNINGETGIDFYWKKRFK
jgi:translocation and assembly module TamB